MPSLRLFLAASLLFLGRSALAQESIWEERLVADAERETFTLTSFRPSYVLFTRAGSSNVAPYAATDPQARLDHEEVKLSISLHTKVGKDVVGLGDLWVAYTQVAYWQAFNSGRSSPFRETNHSPEAYLSFLTDYRVFGLRGRSVNLGIVHESNGQAEPLSRTWNRVYAEVFLLRQKLGISVRPWVRIGEDDDDNPDIENYVGRYELRAFYEEHRRVYAVMVRNLGRGDRYNLELNWSFPIAGRLRGLVQFYKGYGETLIDYDFKMRRFGVGVLMSDWL